VTQGRHSGLSSVVKDITRIVAAFIMLFGIYIVLYGHLTPGGGFTGGVILAAGVVLVVLAFGRDFSQRLSLTERAASFCDSAGALGFLVVALLGYTVNTFFMARFIHAQAPFRLFSAPAILLANLAIGAKVAAALFGVFLAMAVWRPGPREGRLS